MKISDLIKYATEALESQGDAAVMIPDSDAWGPDYEEAMFAGPVATRDGGFVFIID